MPTASALFARSGEGRHARVTIARRVSSRPSDVWAVASICDAASQAEPRGGISRLDLEEVADGLGYEVDYVNRIYAELRDKRP